MFCLKYFGKQIRRIFKLKPADKKKNINQILVIGGYGYKKISKFSN